MPKRATNLNSLKTRLIVSALLFILVLMPLIGLTLNDAFKEQVKSASKNELSAYVYSVLAVTEFDNGQLLMPDLLLENQFNVIQSGLYALITMPNVKDNDPRLESDSTNLVSDRKKETGNTRIAWQSDSFLGFKAPANLPHPATGQSEFSEIKLEGKPYLIYSFTASFEQSAQSDGAAALPITLHIIKDQVDFQRQVDLFTKQLWSWLLILMALLVIVQIVWLLWTLKPLAKFTKELNDIEQGRTQQLNEIYPTELQAVARQLNALLNTEQSQRKRYRNALSDLAHSLKTPLAVIQSQKGLNHAAIEQISIINSIIGHQLKRAQTAAGASWHLGIKVKSVSDKLIRTLHKIYREPQISISQNINRQAVFKGDEADLTEILGNVLDNACKAATSQVALTVTSNKKVLIITVEDDGKGISPEQHIQIFERGMRADSYQSGHGIGLAIVRDLTDSYNGQLAVSTSQTLGGAKFEFHFRF
ncbi:sensor histidine kinase with ATPase domain [Psychromonas ingrahamii 37]|uniref:histidine kinase n=1 Tax=Psychromonas ingrahamii (strain DSM 17664 / CCUG 51855 / 37) TaxID=357804 RepID=A1SRN2_PSYIN|nr:ATP-binding protein [Psychromonas ingrahamii]ABM02147.1 sensor histidine kinase with ATPase domain [Psychromonas ingrahamii 37]